MHAARDLTDDKFVGPGKDRNKIQVAPNTGKKSPEVAFPASAADLKSYNLTSSGLYVKELQAGDPAGRIPQEGDVIEINYVATVCEAAADGTYDCATRAEAPEIYPNLPQGILKDSPRYDSSYDRGRSMKVRYGKGQLTLGLEEALRDMKPGGSKLVFMTPDQSYACPKGRICVSDLEVDERLALRVDLVSVGATSSIGN